MCTVFIECLNVVLEHKSENLGNLVNCHSYYKGMFRICFQSSCTVNSGASGGPLVSRDGQLIGIVVCNAR